MKIHRAPALVLCTLALAACQPSPPAAQQTQQAQSAFNAAIAAAQTQAAPTPSPVPTLIPSQAAALTSAPESARPVPTLSAAMLELRASSVQTFMEGVLQGVMQGMTLRAGTPLEAHVTFVRYEYYDDGSAARMEVGVQRSDQTTDWTASSAATSCLVATFSTQASPSGASRQRTFAPAQLRTFRIHIYDLSGNEHARIFGNWEDVLAYGAGSITLEDFLARVDFQQGID